MYRYMQLCFPFLGFVRSLFLFEKTQPTQLIWVHTVYVYFFSLNTLRRSHGAERSGLNGWGLRERERRLSRIITGDSSRFSWLFSFSVRYSSYRATLALARSFVAEFQTMLYRQGKSLRPFTAFASNDTGAWGCRIPMKSFSAAAD